MTKKQWCLKGIEDAKIPEHLLIGRTPYDISWIPCIDNAWKEFTFAMNNPQNMNEIFLQNFIAVIIQKYPGYSEQDIVSIFKLSTTGDLGEIFGIPERNFYLSAYMKWVKVYANLRYHYEVELERKKSGVVRAQDVGELLIYGFKTGNLSRELCYQIHGKAPEELEMPRKYLEL